MITREYVLESVGPNKWLAIATVATGSADDEVVIYGTEADARAFGKVLDMEFVN